MLDATQLVATQPSDAGNIAREVLSGRRASRSLICSIALCIVAAMPTHAFCQSQSPESYEAASPNQERPATKSPDKSSWNLVASEDSKAWEVCVFGGEGDVVFEKDAIKMSAGDPLTGVKCLADIPRENFEIELESRRTSNFDFFCGLTFPVGEGQCSLILGGWAGAIVGLSSIDGEDASENATKTYMSFDNDKWYKVRVRVDEDVVRCWVDDKLVVKQERGDHEFDIRVEMDLCTPVGLAAFMCDSEYRNFRWRAVKPAVGE